MQMLLLLFFVSSLTLVLHSLGTQFYFYWLFWWFDLLMHALGGFSLGLLVSFFLPRKVVYVFFLLLLFLLLTWEVFEAVVLGLHVGGMRYIVDTVIDVYIGLISGCAAFALYFRR